MNRNSCANICSLTTKHQLRQNACDLASYVSMLFICGYIDIYIYIYIYTYDVICFVPIAFCLPSLAAIIDVLLAYCPLPTPIAFDDFSTALCLCTNYHMYAQYQIYKTYTIHHKIVDRALVTNQFHMRAQDILLPPFGMSSHFTSISCFQKRTYTINMNRTTCPNIAKLTTKH